MNTKVFTTSVIYLFVVCLKTSERQKMFLYFFNEFSKKNLVKIPEYLKVFMCQ